MRRQAITRCRPRRRWFAVAGFLLSIALAPTAAAAEIHERKALLDAALATVTVDEIRGHVGLLADDTLEGREAGKRGGRAAARYIEVQLANAGLPPAGDNGGYLQRFNPGYQNLLGKVPGTDPKLRDEYILIGAHYDHVGYGTWKNSNGPVGYIHNGADDNASGVATMLELVDALTRTHWQPRRSILIAFWDGEEIDLLGSRHWVRQPTVPLANVKLAINVDMIGRLREGRLEVGGTRTGAGLRQLLSSSSLPEGLRLDFTWEYKENSDHWPLFEAGVPSLIVHTGLHDDYHTPRDDFEKVNLAGIRTGTTYLLETVCRLADAESLPTFRPASRSENVSLQRARQAPLPPAAGRLGIFWSPVKNSDADAAVVIQVDRVIIGSPAAKAGVVVGDQITAVNGREIHEPALLPAAVLRAENEIELTVLRNGDTQALVVTLDGAPVELGISWREDDAEPGAVFVTRVIPYSPAARAGLAVHDRIYALDGEPFADGNGLLHGIQRRLAENAESMRLEIETAGSVRTVDVNMRLPGGDQDQSL